jgi:SPP1 family predicted phage head-tail adaptor
MMWRDQISLLTTTQTRNSYGEYVDGTETSRTVYANKKSVKFAEFYQARAQDIQADIIFEVYVIDYQDEKRLKFNNITYYIIRTYSKNGETVELTCSRHPMG